MKNITLRIKTALNPIVINRALSNVGCWIETIERESAGYKMRICAPSDLRLLEIDRVFSQYGCDLFAVKQNNRLAV